RSPGRRGGGRGLPAQQDLVVDLEHVARLAGELERELVLLGGLDRAADRDLAPVRARGQVGAVEALVEREGQLDLGLERLVVEVLAERAAALGGGRKR